ncbi:hypothetical protein D3C80_862480 [compost metagenome]
MAVLEEGLQDQRHQRQNRQQGGGRKGADEVILVVENLDVQRQGVGQAANMAGYHRDSPELAHGPGIGQQHAIQQGPADVGQGDEDKDCGGPCAQGQGGQFLVRPLLLHQRDQLARHIGQGDKDGRQDDGDRGEHDLQPGRVQPGREPARSAEQQNPDQAGNNRRHRQRQVDQSHQQGLADEVEAGDAPGGGQTEDGVQRRGDGRGHEGQAGGGPDIGLGQADGRRAHALAQSFGQDDAERREHDQHQPQQGQADQQAASEASFA